MAHIPSIGNPKTGALLAAESEPGGLGGDDSLLYIELVGIPDIHRIRWKQWSSLAEPRRMTA
jgi:hypothetical protein